MASIKHRVGVRAAPRDVWRAITTSAGLSGWWSTSASGVAEPGTTLELDFADLVTLTFQIDALDAQRRLRLRNVGGPGPWDGSRLTVELAEDDVQTFVTLHHENDIASDEDFQFFVTKWPLYLVSLKSYVETGKGQPYPNDVKIQVEG